jgi:hypothetical protein
MGGSRPLTADPETFAGWSMIADLRPAVLRCRLIQCAYVRPRHIGPPIKPEGLARNQPLPAAAPLVQQETRTQRADDRPRRTRRAQMHCQNRACFAATSTMPKSGLDDLLGMTLEHFTHVRCRHHQAEKSLSGAYPVLTGPEKRVC